MIHGYHVILPMYGFWLPNDPRGSWSDYVRRWEIAKFGKPLKTLERKELNELTEEEIRERDEAKAALCYPPVSISDDQALTVAEGFRIQTLKSHYTIWACAIMPEHTHMVLARHSYHVERMVNLLKGSTTTEMMKMGNHPLKSHAAPGERPPRMWSAHEWKVFLDSEDRIRQAIAYVERNPENEGQPEQSWNFVSPFAGINTSGWTTYH
ncbi:MAG: transposase [Planctomycetaceae bacterium]